MFASHVQQRSYEDKMAEQMTGLSHPMGRVLDLMFGGGRCHFLPNTSAGHNSCREDDKDIISLAKKEQGWHFIEDRALFDALRGGLVVSLPMLGLFADTDIPMNLIAHTQKPTPTTPHWTKWPAQLSKP